MKQTCLKKLLLPLTVFIYSLALLVYTYPYIIFGRKYLFGFPSDKLTALWDFWWRKNAPFLGYSTISSPLIEAPWVVNFSGLLDQHFYLWLRTLLGTFFGSVELFNILLFLVLLFSFSTTLYLVKYLTKSTYSAWFSATAFATGQYIYWHATQNIEISLAASLLPLFFLCLFRLEDSLSQKEYRFSLFWSLSAGTTLLLISLSTYYLGYFTVLAFVGYFVIRRLLNQLLRNESAAFLRTLFYYLLILAAFILLFSPILRAFFDYWRGSGGETPEAELLTILQGRNSVADLIAFGARPWDYLLPSSSHPLFGHLVTSFYQFLREKATYQFWSTFLPERPNYLTFAIILPALYAIFKAFRPSSFSRQDKVNILSLFLLSVWMFLVSLPAVITFHGTSFYLPSFFLFKLFPEFRVYARAGVFVLLGMVVLAGYGLKAISEAAFGCRLSVRWKKSLILAIPIFFTVMILFENLNWAPVAAMDAEKIPQVYQWLTNQKGDLMIVEYPKDNSNNDLGGGCPAWLSSEVVRDYNRAYELFYFRFHRKMLFGFNRLPLSERALLGDLSNPQSYELLKKYGVTTVVIHTKDPMIGIHPFPYPQENPLDECWQRRIMKAPEKVYEKFVKEAEFEDGVVYSVQRN